DQGLQDSNIHVRTIENLFYDGQKGNDTLTVKGDRGLPGPETDHFVHTPGSAVDSGRVDDTNLSFGSTMLGISYQNLGLGGNIEIYGGNVGDTLSAMGTGDSDNMSLQFTGTNEALINLSSAAGSYIPLSTEGIQSYELRTLEGDDVINLNGRMNATGTVS